MCNIVKSLHKLATASQDSEDKLNFAVLHGIKPDVEAIPLDEVVAAAYDRMMANKARFRVVFAI